MINKQQLNQCEQWKRERQETCWCELERNKGKGTGILALSSLKRENATKHENFKGWKVGKETQVFFR